MLSVNASVLLTTVAGMFATKASMYIPPLNAFAFLLALNEDATCTYGDLIKICPSGSSTCAKPPCPCIDTFMILFASFIKNTSISVLFLAVLELFDGSVR